MFKTYHIWSDTFHNIMMTSLLAVTLLSDECFVQHWTVRALGPGQGYYTPAPGSAQAAQLSPSRLVLTDHHQPTESPSCDHPPATSHPIQSRADGADSVHSKQVVCLLASTNHGPGAQLSANQRAG